MKEWLKFWMAIWGFETPKPVPLPSTYRYTPMYELRGNPHRQSS